LDLSFASFDELMLLIASGTTFVDTSNGSLMM
jgi:hypothetical protein